MRIVFDRLPNEVLLAIIIRIPPGTGDFRKFLLVNRHLRELVQGNRTNITQWISHVQSPIADRIVSSHPVEYMPSGEWLECRSRNTEEVEEFVKAMHDFQDSNWAEQKPWNKNGTRMLDDRSLRAGLHHFRGPPSPQLKAFIDAVPPSDCFAMRHASLAILTLLSTIDYNGLVVEVEEDDSDVPEKSFSQRVLIASIESTLILEQDTFNALRRISYHGKRELRSCCMPENLSQANRLLRLYNQATSNHGTLCRAPHGLPKSHLSESGEIENLLTERIRDVYHRWHAISVKERHLITQRVHLDNDGEDKAHELIKSYILTDRHILVRRGFKYWVWSAE